MKKRKKQCPEREQVKQRLTYRIMLEKEYTEGCAAWMVDRMGALIDHMQYGHALIAYKRQNGEFRLAKATLVYYERIFGRPYSLISAQKGTLVYWDVEAQGWRNLLIENFLEWRPVV